MQRKLIFLLVFILMVFGLVACGDLGGNQDDKDDTKSDLDKLYDVMDEIEIPETVTTGFSLPSVINGVTITWTSNNESAIEILNDRAIVVRSNRDVMVTLTGTFTIGNETDTRPFVVIVTKDGGSTGQPANVSVTFNVDFPENTPDGDIYLVGNFNGVGQYPNWDESGSSQGIKATRDGFTASVTLEVNIHEAYTFEYKWTRGNWESVEKNADNSEMENRIKVVTSQIATVNFNDVVEKWFDVELFEEGLEEEITVTINFSITAPANTPNVYVMGDFNEWDFDKALKLVKQEDGNYTGFVEYTTNKLLVEYKFVNGLNWDYEESQENTLNPNHMITLDGETLTVDVDYEISAWKAIYDEGTLPEEPVEYTINFSVTAPEGTEKVYVAGSFNGWDIENALELDKQEDGSFTLTHIFKTNIKTIEYKFFKNQTYNLPEGNIQGKFLEDRIFELVELEHNLSLVILTWEGDEVTLPEEPVEYTINFSITAPANTPNVYVMGDFNGWDFENILKLTKQDDGKYTGFVEYTTNKLSVEYKFVNGLNWDYEESQENTENPNHMITLNGETLIVDVIYEISAWVTISDEGTLPEEPVEYTINFSVTAPEGTEKVYVAGSFNGWNFDKAEELIKNETTGLFELELTVSTTATSIKYKFFKDQTSENPEGDATGSLMGDRSLNLVEDNLNLVELTILTWEGGSTGQPANVSVTFNVDFPENTPAGDIYLVGNFSGAGQYPNWDEGGSSQGIKATRDGFTASVTLEVNIHEAYTFEYKWTRGNWESVEKNADNSEMENRIKVVTSQITTVNFNDVVAKWFDVELFEEELDEEVDYTINFSLTAPEHTPNVYVIGDFNGWDFDNALELVKQEDGTFTGFVEYTTNKLSVEYKFANGLHWDYQESQENTENPNHNITLDGETVIVDVSYEILAWEAIYDEGTLPEEPVEYTINFSVTAPAGTENVYLVGDLNGWDIENALELVKQEDETFTITHIFETKLLTIKFKFFKDQSYDLPEGDSQGEFLADRTLDLVGLEYDLNLVILTWEGDDVTLPEEPVEYTINFSVTAPEGTENVYVVGSFNGWLEEESQPLHLNRVDETWVFTGQAKFETEAQMVEYKFVNKLDWLYEENHDNRVIELNDLTINETVEINEWKATHTVSVTFSVLLPSNTPIEDEIYLVGETSGITGVNSWTSDGLKATRDGDVASITIDFAILEDLSFSYMWTRGTWETEEVEQNNSPIEKRRVLLTTEQLEMTENDEVIKWKDLAFFSNTVESSVAITLTIYVILPESDNGTDLIYIAGDFDKIEDKDYPHWDAAGILMTRIEGANLASVTFEFSTNINHKFEFKFTKGDWNNAEPRDNRTLTIRLATPEDNVFYVVSAWN